MKGSCCLIQDLLPLYYDGVCSEESKKIIEKHLAECSDCKAYYSSLCEADEVLLIPENKENEMKKAASFHAVKKRILKKQIALVLVVVVLFAAISFSMIGVLKNSEEIILYEDNITVSMTEDQLIGRLQGNQANYCKIKRVDRIKDGQTHTYLFFYLSGTKWNDITTNDNVFSEYVLCSTDKGAEQIDRVYYYTGDYKGIESMNENEIQSIMDDAILLWNP